MVAKIKVVKMGINFGCIAKVVVGRKVVGQTKLCPASMAHVAVADAKALAAKLGYSVA